MDAMTETFRIRWIIAPILAETYSDSEMVSDLGKSLSERIYSYNSRDDERYDREGMIMRSVWDSFAGGNTAASVAHKIEQALQVRERNGVVIETCREDLGVEYGHDRCNLPADFILWGKLSRPRVLAPVATNMPLSTLETGHLAGMNWSNGRFSI